MKSHYAMRFHTLYYLHNYSMKLNISIRNGVKENLQKRLIYISYQVIPVILAIRPRIYWTNFRFIAALKWLTNVFISLYYLSVKKSVRAILQT